MILLVVLLVVGQRVFFLCWVEVGLVLLLWVVVLLVAGPLMFVLYWVVEVLLWVVLQVLGQWMCFLMCLSAAVLLEAGPFSLVEAPAEQMFFQC